MDANKIRLLDFIRSSKRQFNIPVYQRNYEWRKEQCLRLFEDIQEIALKEYTIEHFLGTVVYVEGRNKPDFREFVIIDGQQRITSIMLLFRAIYDLLDDQCKRAEIMETILTNRFVTEELRIKLKPIHSDKAVFDKIIDGKKIITDSNLMKNYLLFKKLIEESQVSVEEIYNALAYVDIVYISLEKEKKSENPQLIFESLNSTGLSLTQADLIRNFLLMNHEYDKQSQLFNNYWLEIEKLIPHSRISDFVRDYLTMKTGSISRKDRVYENFKKYVIRTDNFDEEGILEELTSYAKFYSWIVNCNSPYQELNNLMQQLLQLKSTVTYPALMYIFEDCFSYKKLKLEELNEIIKTTISYLFRRVICDYPTNALNKIFAAATSEIDKKIKLNKNYYEVYVEILAGKTGSGMFPRNEEFKRAFMVKELYKTKVDKYLFFQLEKHKNKEVISLDQGITIEHIMPQKLTPAWQIVLGKKYVDIHSNYLHTIGNLTLSGYNPELSNKKFEEKKIKLMESNISLNRQLNEYDVWNEYSIKDRAEKLFVTASEIWSIPDKFNSVNQKSSIDYSKDYNIMEDIDATGMKPKELVIQDSIYKVTSWKELLSVLSRELYDLDRDMFTSFTRHKDFEGRERRIIDVSKEVMKAAVEVAVDIYIETNMNSNTILNYCKLLAEKYNLENDIYFNLRLR